MINFNVKLGIKDYFSYLCNSKYERNSETRKRVLSRFR